MLEAGPQGETLHCRGEWTIDSIGVLERRMPEYDWPSGHELCIDAADIAAMDTAGAWLLHRTVAMLEQRDCKVTMSGLSAAHQSLLEMVQVAPTDDISPALPEPGILETIGRHSTTRMREAVDLLAFVGESAVAFLRAVVQPGRIRWQAILQNLQLAGFNALPITGLLSFLMGVVIAYQGAEQLRRYGANIFIADLVGLAMLRELAPLLTAVIIAGRSGSAYTAQIGTMKLTEEIDALRTMGIAPMDLLVLPKMLALMVALPLLTVYADIMGVLGGMVVASTYLSVGFGDFLDRFGDAIGLSSYLVGVGKAPVFAAVIALVGCFQGFRVAGSADSVGRQTTVSVVQSIFLVIVIDAAFSVVFNWLDL